MGEKIMFGNPEITYGDIKCEECGRHFSKIGWAHLKTHGKTIVEYKNTWGYNRSQPLECLRIKETRQKANKEWGGNNNLTRKFSFKPGHVNFWRDNPIREQMRIKLEKLAINVQSSERFRDIQKEISKGRKRNKGQFA